jgi:hypothetical protein
MHERASCQEALYLEPFAKPFNPVVAWQALLRHAEEVDEADRDQWQDEGEGHPAQQDPLEEFV